MAETDVLEEEEQKPPYRFVSRVLAVSFPTALMLLAFVVLDEVSVISAILGFCMVVSFNIILTMPFFTNLQTLTQYTNKLAQNEDVTALPQIGQNEGDESVQIVQAITQMRSVWLSKNAQLEAQTISDSAVLDSLPDPLLMLNGQGDIIGANQAARTLFGENIREKKVSDLFYMPALLAAVADVLAGNETHQALELVLGYRVFNVKIDMLPVMAKHGAVAAMSLYDITAQKKLEQAQIDFIANASHELKTPLSVLSGFIETLQTTAKDDPKAQEEFLKIMQTQAQRMAKLISNLLSLSKIQMNEHDEISEIVSIGDILKTVRFTLEEPAKRRDVTISIKNAKPAAPVYGDTGELTQVFQNVIENAVKYCDEGTKISVICHNEETADEQKEETTPMYAVTVHNVGNPIPAEYLPRLSERFFRVNTVKNKASGTGLGLAIVEQILKHHRGFMKVDSSEENGTNFTVYLPMRFAAPEISAPEASE